MTNLSISLIGVRILAFFFLGQAIVELPTIYFMLAFLPYADTSYGIRTEQIVLACSTVAAPFLVGAVMLAWSRRLARWIVPDPIGAPKHANTPDLSQLHAVALSLLGLLMIWYTIPNFLATWADYYEQRYVHRVDELSRDAVISLVSHTLIVSLGIALFAGRGFFVRLFRKFREFGLE